jgi:hypothetical protein
MSRLRVKLVLNEGGEGAPLGQIVDIGREVERFLRYLAEDAGIGVERREWVAREFENASVRFDIEAPVDLTDEALASFNRKFDYVDKFDPEKQTLNGVVRHQTILQYAKTAEALGAHERMSFGLYRPKAEKPYEYKRLSKLRAIDLQQRLTEKVRLKSTIQGKIHNLGVEEHYFNLRERKSGRLIRCDFPPALYDEVHAAATDPEALIYVRGTVSQRRVDRFIEGVKVQQIKPAPRAPEVFTKLFGQFPGYTGDLTTQEFIDRSWGDDD